MNMYDVIGSFRWGHFPHQHRRTLAKSAKVKEIRRRVLLKKGTRIHLALLKESYGGSLAMLDASGVVVSWYDDTHGNCAVHERVVERHVAQFYVPDDVANSLPARHLSDALNEGSSTQHGWRKRADGAVFWGTTVIKAVILRSGSLQGFSYISRVSKTPWNALQAAAAEQPRWLGQQRLLNEH